MIIQWIIIAILILIAFIFLRMDHVTRKFKIATIIIVGFLLYFSMVSIFSSQEVDLTSPRGIVNGVYVYFGWIGRTATSLWDVGTETVHMVGNAIKTGNSTKKSEEDQFRRRR